MKGGRGRAQKEEAKLKLYKNKGKISDNFLPVLKRAKMKKTEEKKIIGKKASDRYPFLK